MTDAEIEADCRARIEALFASVHPEKGDFAYVTFGDWIAIESVPYIAFANGALKNQGAAPAPWPEGDIAEAMAAAVRAQWPDSAERILVWRHHPRMEHEDGSDLLYMRLCALPTSATSIEVIYRG